MMNEKQITLADHAAVEQVMIERLIMHLNNAMTLMRIGSITNKGVAEVYDVLTTFRYKIHHDFESALDCGCKELREQDRKRDKEHDQKVL